MFYYSLPRAELDLLSITISYFHQQNSIFVLRTATVKPMTIFFVVLELYGISGGYCYLVRRRSLVHEGTSGDDLIFVLDLTDVSEYIDGRLAVSSCVITIWLRRAHKQTFHSFHLFFPLKPKFYPHRIPLNRPGIIFCLLLKSFFVFSNAKDSRSARCTKCTLVDKNTLNFSPLCMLEHP